MPVFPETEEVKHARELEAKFRFYVVALVFTILAASIQTATFGRSNIEDSLELAGWIALAIAGFSGLSLLEWTTVGLLQNTRRNEFRKLITKLKALQNAGTTEYQDAETLEIEPVVDSLGEYEESLAKLEKIISRDGEKHQIKYQTSKWAFVFAIFFLMMSRGLGAVVSMFGQELL